MIVNFWEFFVHLEHLAPSVKPGGHLHNNVAEVAIQVIESEKTKVKPAKQHVLPLRVTIFLQSGHLNRTEVTHVFRHVDNHLSHRQMVMFPMLEELGSSGSEKAGHHYLLVLNLRAKRLKVPANDMKTCEHLAMARQFPGNVKATTM